LTGGKPLAPLLKETRLKRRDRWVHGGLLRPEFGRCHLLGGRSADRKQFLPRPAPDWTPTPQDPGPAFRMTDFLTFAGVDPAMRPETELRLSRTDPSGS